MVALMRPFAFLAICVLTIFIRMHNHERQAQFDSVDNFDWDILEFSVRQHTHHAGGTTRVDSAAFEGHHNNSEGSDEDAVLHGQGDPSHGCMTPDVEGWQNIYDDADLLDSDEGIEGHQVRLEHHDLPRAGNSRHGSGDDSEFSGFIRSLFEPVGAPGGFGGPPNGTNAAPGVRAPNSPSSMYPEPGSSGSSGNNSSDSSMQNSLQLPAPHETTGDVFAYMSRSDDPTWQSTPANYFTADPLWLTPNFIPGLNYVPEEDEYYEEDEEYDDDI